MIKNLIRPVTAKNLALATLCFLGFSAAQGQSMMNSASYAMAMSNSGSATPATASAPAAADASATPATASASAAADASTPAADLSAMTTDYLNSTPLDRLINYVFPMERSRDQATTYYPLVTTAYYNASYVCFKKFMASQSNPNDPAAAAAFNASVQAFNAASLVYSKAVNDFNTGESYHSLYISNKTTRDAYGSYGSFLDITIATEIYEAKKSYDSAIAEFTTAKLLFDAIQ